jgi:hypothetical protein
MPKPALLSSAVALAAVALAAPAHADAYQMHERDLTVVPAAPGRDTAEPFKPTWCAKVKAPGARNAGPMRRTLESWMQYGGDESPGKLAEYLCDAPDDPNVQKTAAAAIQVWMNWSGLDQKQATASFLARIDLERWHALRDETCARFASTDEDSEEVAATRHAYRAIYGCPKEPPSWLRKVYPKNLAFFIDRDADIPELLRAYLVFHGLGDAAKVKPDDGFNLKAYALWGTDARRLDAGKLDQQIAADAGNDYQQWVARETFAAALAAAKQWEALVGGIGGKDPDMKRLLVDVPEAAWVAWVALRDKHAQVFADGAAFEQLANSPSLSAVKGCDATLRPHVEKLLQRLARGSEKDTREAVMSDPVGGPLMERYVLCEAMLKNKSYAASLYPLFDSTRGHRGPRMAVHIAALDALSEILADRPKFLVQPAMMGAPGHSTIRYRVSNLGGSATNGEAKGVVASTKAVEDGVLVTFKKESYREQDWDCKPNNRIYAIRADGTVVYDEDCKPAGSHEVDITPKPVVIPKRLAAGIAKGKLLVFRADSRTPSKGDAGTFIADPSAVFDSKAMKKLEAVWGFAL